jgi:DNA modification methylase
VTDESVDRVILGDCVEVMKTMPPSSVSAVLTDPPYLVRYKDRDGRTIINDDNAAWLEPAFAQMYKVLKPGGSCISFYAWNKVDQFMVAWKKAGFAVTGHIVFTKKYASSQRFMRHQHEQAYLLAKNRPELPNDRHPMSSRGPIRATACIRPRNLSAFSKRSLRPFQRPATRSSIRSAGLDRRS